MVDQPSGRESSSRAAEIAAQQVESIVSAAQAAADQLRHEAEREAGELRAAGERDAAKHVDKARAEALRLGQDARREAEKLQADAEHEAEQIREQTRRQVQGRVAAAEEAASEVMEEAQALSSGLKRLGQMLGDQGERILRDVQAAHRRMQSDLQVAPEPGPARPAAARRAPRAPAGEEDEALETLRRAVAGESEPGAERSARPSREPRTRERGRGPERSNPIDDLDVPNWVEPS